MKKLTAFIHRIVRLTNTEGLFINLLGRIHPFFSKFIPLPEDYPFPSFKVVRRDGVMYNLCLNDYMQWHIFAGLSDLSWQKAKEFMDKESTILDVGANVGAFSLKLAHYIHQQRIENCKVIAFEPNPLICEAFVINTELNPELKKIVSLERIALGAENNIGHFVFSKSNTGGGKITDKGEKFGIEVEIKTLDDYVQRNQLKNIRFIKIDVEGFEPLVILGANETIREQKPALFIEMTEKWFREQASSTAEIIQYLKDLDYQLFAEIEDQFVEIDKANLESIEQYNLLAL